MQLHIRTDTTHVLTCEGTETISEIKNRIAELVQINVSEICLFAGSRPIGDSTLVSTLENTDLEVTVNLLGGKVHGSLARAGKVKDQTPQVEKQEKPKKNTGRAKKRMQYNKRFVNVEGNNFARAPGPNAQSQIPMKMMQLKH